MYNRGALLINKLDSGAIGNNFGRSLHHGGRSIRNVELYAEQQPQNGVCGNDGGQSKGNTDLEEVRVLNFVAFLAQNADTSIIAVMRQGDKQWVSWVDFAFLHLREGIKK